MNIKLKATLYTLTEILLISFSLIFNINLLYILLTAFLVYMTFVELLGNIAIIVANKYFYRLDKHIKKIIYSIYDVTKDNFLVKLANISIVCNFILLFTTFNINWLLFSVIAIKLMINFWSDINFKILTSLIENKK